MISEQAFLTRLGCSAQTVRDVLRPFLDNESIFRVVREGEYASLIDIKNLSCTAVQRQQIDRHREQFLTLFTAFRSLLGCFLDGAGYVYPPEDEEEDGIVLRQARRVFDKRYSQDLLNVYSYLHTKINPEIVKNMYESEDLTRYENRTDRWYLVYRNLSVFDTDRTKALRQHIVSEEDRYSPAYKALCYANLLKYHRREELLPKSAYRTRREPYGPILSQRRSEAFRSTPY